MKRDMDLVREILRTLEARSATSNVLDVQIAGRDRLEVWEHLEIMKEAGLVRGVHLTGSSTACNGLTWQGHEFLETCRNDTIWRKAKDTALNATGGTSLDVMKSVLTNLCLKAVGLS